jgi:hypothetical protein
MIKVKNVARAFKINSTIVNDPNPQTCLADAVKSLTLAYPVLRHTQVLESDAELNESGDTLIYTVHLPPVKTKG